MLKRKSVPLQPNDLKKLFSVDTALYRRQCVKDWYIHAYRFIVVTGIRPGELADLQNKRDLDGKYCTIWDFINVHSKLTKGKSDRARRTFVLPERALKEIAA